jgi:phosphoglycolate phosphatase-like HAD superfamily hydrolase
MVAIGVTTGAVDAESLSAAGATVVVASLTELLVELRRRGAVS